MLFKYRFFKNMFYDQFSVFLNIFKNFPCRNSINEKKIKSNLQDVLYLYHHVNVQK